MTKKQKIKKIIFKNNVRNSAIIYKLYINNELKPLLNRIKPGNVKVKYNRVIKKLYITAEEQFITTLDCFITYFQNHFSFIRSADIELILPLLFKSKYCDIFFCKYNKNEDKFIGYYINHFKKIITDHFANNLMLLSTFMQIKLDLTDDFNIKKIDFDNQDIVDKLFEFLIDLVYCNNDIYDIYCLFESIYNYERRLLSKKRNILDVDEACLKYYSIKWESNLDNYYKKIDFIRQIRDN